MLRRSICGRASRRCSGRSTRNRTRGDRAGPTLVLAHEAPGNLAAHPAGREGFGRPEFTDAKREVRITTLIDASAAEAWRTPTDPERVAEIGAVRRLSAVRLVFNVAPTGPV